MVHKPDVQDKGKDAVSSDSSGKPHDAIAHVVQQQNTPGGDCTSTFKSHKSATHITTLEFDSCYYGQTTKDGHSRQLETPVMQSHGDGKPKPQLEKITTEGITPDRSRLAVFMHELPSVRPVYFDTKEGRTGGTAFMVSKDGLMVTNNHVVENSGGTLKVKILNQDGTEEERTAHVVKQVANQDLALLQVDHKPGEVFKALKLSQETSWRANEQLVEMGNANGEGSISMAKASFGSLINQDKIPFDKQPPDVFQGRTMYKLHSAVPPGYSGGVVLSVPGSDRDSAGNVTRQGTSAVRAITDYSDTDKTAYVIPAARVQSMLNDYYADQTKSKK